MTANIERRESGVLVATESESARKVPDGGCNADDTLTLAPETKHCLFRVIGYSGGGILRTAEFYERWVEELTELLKQQGLEWEQRT